MSFDTDWDVNKYRTSYESEEHWEIRRAFMEAHKTKYPEGRLVCLAAVFTNIELLGCRYPLETTNLVNELGEDVIKSYREARKDKLKRTFVKASDAAEAKHGKGRSVNSPSSSFQQTSDEVLRSTGLEQSAKESEPVNYRQKRPIDNESHGEKSQIPMKKRPSYKEIRNSIQNMVREFRHLEAQQDGSVSNTNNNRGNQQVMTGLPSQSFKKRQRNKLSQAEMKFVQSAKYSRPDITQQTGEQDVASGSSGRKKRKKNRGKANIMQGISIKPVIDPLQKIVVVENSALTDRHLETLYRTATACNMPPKVTYNSEEEGVECSISLGNTFLAKAVADSKQNAVKKASEQGLERLKKMCYTLKVKQPFVSFTEVNKESVSVEKNTETDEVDSSNSTKLSDDNVGNKLLRMMGWTGGGLGKSSQGIVEPISVSSTVHRSGLGHQDSPRITKEFKDRIRNIVLDFIRTDTGERDLTFSKDFNKYDRAAIHTIAHRLGLQTKSRNKDGERFLVAYKPRKNVHNIVEDLLKNGNCDEKYELIPPAQSNPENL